jgi:hypothetical protein
MIRLKDRKKPGPNGFMLHEKRTGWQSWIVDPVSQWDFFLLCRRYQEHAKANPGLALPTDMQTIEQMVDLANALRYARIPNAEEFYERTTPFPKRMAPQQALSPQVQAGGFFQNVVGHAKNLEAGRRTLSEWWGAGGVPVAQELADGRGSICAVCPENDGAGLLAKFTVEAAAKIQANIEELNNQKLVTIHDAELEGHVCKACDCPLRLKVWTPLKHIVQHMPGETKAKLDRGCWILKELVNAP